MEVQVPRQAPVFRVLTQDFARRWSDLRERVAMVLVKRVCLAGLSVILLSPPLAFALSRDQAAALGKLAAKGDAAAVSQLLKAAKTGSAEAALSVALLYYRGEPIQQDFAQALAWFEESAKRGHPEAMTLAGHMFQEGLGTAQDYAKARQVLSARSRCGRWRRCKQSGLAVPEGPRHACGSGTGAAVVSQGCRRPPPRRHV